MNIRLFCFSSECVQIFCSSDVNEKYSKLFLWFLNYLLHIDHGNIKFSYIYTIEMRKNSLWKTSRWNGRLVYTFDKNNSKNNNKKQDRVTKAFEKFLLSETILSINNLNFLWFKQSIITQTFKASTSTFYWLQICKKITRQFEILPILYFYRFIIIFNLTLQQVFLVIELNEVKNFCQQMSDFSSRFTFENITEIRYEERAFDNFHLLLAYDIFPREILQIESIALLYFEGIGS